MGLVKIAGRMLLAVLLSAALLGGVVSRGASFEDYGDVSGHWAEESLRRGYADGYLTGFEDRTMRPDEAITQAQVLTLLCRVLGADRKADDAALSLPADAWYAEAALQALYLGLLREGESVQDLPLRRGAALELLCRAFCLTGAEPDLTALTRFADAGSLAPEERAAAARLASMGLVEGYDGLLRGESALTRAEFFTLLYRVLDSITLVGCTDSVRDLDGLSGKVAVVRCYEPGELIVGSGEWERLIVAPAGGSVTIDFQRAAPATTLELAGVGGRFQILRAPGQLAILGSGLTVALSGNGESTAVLGRGNTLNVADDVRLRSLRVAGPDSRIALEGCAEELRLSGSGSSVFGTGYISRLERQTADAAVSVFCFRTVDTVDYGLEGAQLHLAPPTIAADASELRAWASVDGMKSPAACTAVWSVNGEAVSEERFTGVTELSVPLRYQDLRDGKIAVSLTVRYTTAQGVEQALSARAEASPPAGSESWAAVRLGQMEELLSGGYAGDYTTQWAVDHDLAAADKELWVNAQGYASDSGYLIWVNLAYQRVNVFTGSAGDWSLEETFLAATGAEVSPTPLGVWPVTLKQTEGWFTATYTVRPVVRFKGGGYAFHSRLFDPVTGELTDPAIGYPVSHGCVRMLDEGIWWIHDNIPIGTTVVVY